MPAKNSTPLGIRVPNEVLARLDALSSQLADYPSRNALAQAALMRGLSTIEAEIAERTAERVEDLDLGTFSEQVLAAAKRSKTGRFGDDRIFISHVWRQFQKKNPKAGLTEASFKTLLVEANRARLLSLVCAGMAPFLDQTDVRESEIRYLSATFHLLCV